MNLGIPDLSLKEAHAMTRKLPSWYPDWDAFRARPFMRPSGAIVGIVVAGILFLKGGAAPALVVLAFFALMWLTVGKRSR